MRSEVTDPTAVLPLHAGGFRHLLKRRTLALLAFALPFGHLAVTVAMLLWVLSELMTPERSRWIRTYRWWFLLPVLYFLLHLIGLTWSQNLRFGLFDIEVKAGLLVIPLCLLAHGRPDPDERSTIVRWFLIGLILAFVSCLVPAIRTWSATGSLHGFFYQDFSRFLHPSYFAWYADTAVLLLWLDPSDRLLKGSLKGGLLLFLSLLVFLCNSKAGFAGWIFATLFGAAVGSNRTKSFRSLLFAAAHVLLFVLLAWKAVPPSENRVQAMQENLRADSLSARDPRSTAIRVHIWEAAWSLVRERPFSGYGTGDVKDVLLDRYAERGLAPAVEKRLNAHNQFLQSWVALGLAGLLLLVWMLPAAAWRFRSSPLFFGFLLLTGFNFLVESMLETQAGVTFWALFYCLFLSFQSPPVTHEDHQPGGRTSPVR